MPKSLPLAVILALFFASCGTTFQYSTISSPDVLKNDRHEFVVENDSLLLKYNFSGQGGPVRISIQNKMNVPVYVDWQRSAIIVDGRATPYATSEMKIAGSFDGNSYTSGNSGYSANSGQLQATAVLPPTMDFIPPRAVVKKYPINVSGANWRIVAGAFQKSTYEVPKGGTVNVKKATFTEATSPMRFRSFITYMVGEPGTQPLALDNSFFVSEVMDTRSGPIKMSANSGNRGDLYYTIRY